MHAASNPDRVISTAETNQHKNPSQDRGDDLLVKEVVFLHRHTFHQSFFYILL